MKNLFSIIILISAFSFGLMLTSCNKPAENSNVGAVSKLSIPNMTAAVNGTTSAAFLASDSLNQSAGTGVVFTTGSTPSNAVVSNIFGMVKNFVSNAKTSDTFACMIEVLANNGIIKTDGTEAVLSDDKDGQFKAKFVVNALGTTLQNFKMYVCMGAAATTNSQYVTGTLSGSEMTFGMKFNFSDALKGSMDMTGSLDGDTWTTKTLTMETATTVAATTYSSKFQIAQSTSTMVVKGIYTPGVVTGTYQTFAKFALIGNSPATYALGAGSSKYALSGASMADIHWDIDGGISSSSSYASDVSSGSYFPTSFTFSGNMTTGETWDCSIGSTATANISAMNTTVLGSLQSCSDNQQ